MPGIFGSGNAEFGSTSKVKKTPQTEHHVSMLFSFTLTVFPKLNLSLKLYYETVLDFVVVVVFVFRSVF